MNRLATTSGEPAEVTARQVQVWFQNRRQKLREAERLKAGVSDAAAQLVALPAHEPDTLEDQSSLHLG